MRHTNFFLGWMSIFFFFGVNGMAQEYKIVKAASKYFMNFTVLYDKQKDEVFGYLELSKGSRPAKKTEKIYYTVLDKNLNKIVSGDFVEPLYNNRAFLRLKGLSYNNGHVILILTETVKVYTKYGYFYKDTVHHYIILDLKENKVVSSGMIEEFVKKEGDAIVRIPKKMVMLAYKLNVRAAPGGFLLDFYFHPYEKIFRALNVIKLIDFNGKELWRKTDVVALKRKDADKSEKILGVEDDYFYSLKKPVYTNTKYTKNLTDELIARSIKNGEVLADRPIRLDEKYFHRPFFSNLKKHKIIFSGIYRDAERTKAHRWRGLYRDIYEWEGTSFKRTAYQFLPYTDMKIPEINEYGRVKNEGYLIFEDVDVLDNDDMIYIAETKYKRQYKGLYFFLINKDFKVVKAKALITEPSKFSKYEFTHEMENNKGRIFVFYDKDSDTEYNIHIVKYLFDTKQFTESIIKVDLYEGDINVYPAKKGYILIVQEYNEPQKDGKLMEIRLEKI